MNIAILLAPIVDPSLPSVQLNVTTDSCELQARCAARQLGPFNEAAIEVGLKFRDRDPATGLAVILFAGSGDSDCVRDVLSRRIEDVIRLDADGFACWDMCLLAGIMARAITALDHRADLVLVGREFGDRDDGQFPPLLAEILDYAFVGCAYAVRRDGPHIVSSRSVDGLEQSVRIAGPVVASITNHPANRIRYPLMKDVMGARKKSARTMALAASPAEACVIARGLALAAFREGTGRPCRMLDGPPGAQARELAAFLRPWKAS